MSDTAVPKAYTQADRQKLTEAVQLLRSSPGFAVLEQCLKALLEERMEQLVTNTSAAVPNLQGRAQQLKDIIAILNRKTS